MRSPLAQINAMALKEKEEQQVLGEALDKTNPRLDTLWKLGKHYRLTGGIIAPQCQRLHPTGGFMS
jgi:hypothetical protein